MATFTAGPASLMRAAISSETAGKISDYVTIKQPPTVVSQNPPAGTPVIQGMTIEVRATSLSDVPWHVIDGGVIQAVKNVPVADIAALVQNDPVLANAAKTGVINEADAAAITAKLNTGLAGSGLSGEMNVTDATNLVKSIGGSGFINF